ncbi:MAG: ATP-grasp domain-containing protein [Candidatus Omnitrophica bacterium]|nr:ATP-grasp domain-containing protein [Candidatus Omnitrophota bacterium]
MRIGIVGAEYEAHTVHMREVLENRRVEVLIIDTVLFPEEATISLIEDEVKYQGESIEDISTFYVRSVFFSHPPYDLEEQRKIKKIDLDGWYADYMGERERQSLLASWLKSATLKGKRVINPIESFDLHYLKAYQLALLRKNNIPVPLTLVTNDSEELKKFQKEVGQLVYKPVAGGAGCKMMIEEDWQEERLKLLRNAPVLFQEYIEGENIRVYVIDNKIVSSGIIHTREVDYRGHEEAIEKIKLPTDIENMCIKAKEICGMKFTGIDLKRKPNKEFVLIECNPSPMFIGFQEVTGDPIDERLADYLIG